MMSRTMLMRGLRAVQPRGMLPVGMRSFATTYTKSHEWISVDGDKATIGITNFAQDALGEIVFVDLPDGGSTHAGKSTIVTLESVKAVGEVYSPADVEVVEVNSNLESNPGLVNESPEKDGWLVKVKLTGDLPTMLSKAEYDAHVAAEGAGDH